MQIRHKVKSVFSKVNSSEDKAENNSSTLYLLSEMEK